MSDDMCACAEPFLHVGDMRDDGSIPTTCGGCGKPGPDIPPPVPV